MKVMHYGLVVFVWLTTTNVLALGIEEAYAPDPNDKPLAVRIWYPNDPAHSSKVRGVHLPLIVISHGTGGSKEGHEDTARALAGAGFVVAAVTHTGDNYEDESYVRAGKHLIGRPRHITRTIDYMLTSWHGHQQIDPKRIGMLGFSAGGFTALVIAGGVPDLTRTEGHCRSKPQVWDCHYLSKNGNSLQTIKPPPAEAWVHDSRVKAAVIAAPAVAYSFEPNGLSGVHIPIQLWGGERDAIVENSAAVVRSLLPMPVEYHLVSGAGHFAFLQPCSWKLRSIISIMSWFGTEEICRDPEGFDRERFHDYFNSAVVQFLSRKLDSESDD